MKSVVTKITISPGPWAPYNALAASADSEYSTAQNATWCSPFAPDKEDWVPLLTRIL